MRDGTNNLKWPIFQAFFKISLTVILVFFVDLPFAQLILFDFILTFNLIIAGLLTPYKLTKRNKDELFQQSAVFLTFYHYICYSDFVIDLEARSTIGWSIIAITSFNLGVSLVREFISSLKGLCLSLRKAHAKHQMNREIKRRALEMAEQRPVRLEEEK